jgi:hypothetical protein
MTIITRELIFSGRSDAGGWNRKQLEVLGIAWPPRHGWIDRLCGREISDSAAAEFLSLKKRSSPLLPGIE